MNELLKYWFEKLSELDPTNKPRNFKVLCTAVTALLAFKWQEAGKNESFKVSTLDFKNHLDIWNRHREVHTVLEYFQSLNFLTIFPNGNHKITHYIIKINFDFVKLCDMKSHSEPKTVGEAKELCDMKSHSSVYLPDGTIQLCDMRSLSRFPENISDEELCDMRSLSMEYLLTGEIRFCQLCDMKSHSKGLKSHDNTDNPLINNVIEYYPTLKRTFTQYIFNYNNNNIVYNKEINTPRDEFYMFLEIFDQLSNKTAKVSDHLKDEFEKFMKKTNYKLEDFANALYNFMHDKWWRPNQHKMLTTFYLLDAPKMEQLLGLKVEKTNQGELFDLQTPARKVTDLTPAEQKLYYEGKLEL